MVSFIPTSWLSQANRNTALYAFLGISNILLASKEEDYFGPRADFNPFVHTWSLGVEEQFYLIFPILFISLVLLKLKQGHLITLGIVVFLSVCSFTACAAFTLSYPVFTFFHISTRFWELGAGVGLALSNAAWHRYLEKFRRSRLEILSVSALIILSLCCIFANEKWFPFPWAFPVAIASATILSVLFTRRRTFITMFFSVSAMRFIGRISYSLYLWHWPIYVLLRWTAGVDTWVHRIAAITSTFVVAVVSYQAIEQPFRRSAILRALPRPAVVAVFAVLILGGLISSRAAFNSPRLYLSVTQNAEVWSPWLIEQTGRCQVK